jgi:uncharacterized protein YkwD
MRNKAFPLFITISIILIFAANIFSQNSSAVLTRSGLTKTSAKTTTNTYELERIIFDLINEKRAENGLPELKWSEEVAKVARLHSQNMANSKFFSHQGLDGLRVDDRAYSLGVKRWQSIGENIASNRGFGSPTEVAVDAWMRSPGHRGNILNNLWQETGIGVAVDNDGKYYFTQVFLLKR